MSRKTSSPASLTRPTTLHAGAAKIEKLVPGGQGLATLANGKKGFFWNTLPGETVIEYEVTKEKSSYFEAIATKIKNPSPHRIVQKDDCYLSTSPWQIMDYDYELSQKVELLEEQFRQQGISLASTSAMNFFDKNAVFEEKVHVEPERGTRPARNRDGEAGEMPCATDNHDFYYRNKMEYSLYFSHDDQKIHLAFKHRGTHRKFPIESSSLERPEIFKRAQEIVADLNARGEEARKYQALLLRADQQGNVSGGLLENGKSHPVFPNLTDQILGKAYSYSPNGFFQINLPVYELALKEIAKHLGDSKNVLDLYSGVGTIGLSVAGEPIQLPVRPTFALTSSAKSIHAPVASDKSLTLVELNGAAFKELEKNCVGFKNARPVLSASEEALNFIEPGQTVIVDPPRAGLDDKLIARLLEVTPETLIYLSCNPATQSRDAKKLLEKYQIISCTPFNFFPRTPHLENLLVFAKA